VCGYRPAERSDGPAFSGIRTFMRLPHVPLKSELDGVDLGIIGLPFDTGASFGVGCRFGPEAVRSASALLRPYHPDHELDIFSHFSAVDFGDVAIIPGFIEESLARIETAINRMVTSNIIHIGIGGDHTIALGELRGLAARYRPMSLILFDSHPDTYPDFRGHPYFHSTPFRRAVEENLINPARSILCGLRGSTFGKSDLLDPIEMGFDILNASYMHRITTDETAQRIVSRVGSSPCFLSFDIDFLDPAFAPGTGTPEIGGFTTWETQDILRKLAAVNIVGADVVEVLPSADTGRVTALAAATIVHEIISLVSLRMNNKAFSDRSEDSALDTGST
jgi:agmatinase